MEWLSIPECLWHFRPQARWVEASRWLHAARVGMGCNVPVSVAQPFVLTNIRPDAIRNPGIVTAWAPFHPDQVVPSKPCFPEALWSFPPTQSQFSLQVSPGSILKTNGDCKERTDGSKPFHSLPGEGDGQHTKPQHSAGAPVPFWGYCLVEAGHAANPGGLLLAEARGHGRWLSWSSVLILSCL